MNKKRVDENIFCAKKALEECGIARDGKVEKAYRGQISTFGAAVVTGSLKAAVAFFSEKGGSDVDRPKLLEAMYYVIKNEKISAKKVLDYVCLSDEKALKEEFIDASVAIKLAMNFYDLV